MLKTRVLTAVVLIPLVLAALFGLGTRDWGAVTLIIVVIAASEWGKLAGYRRLTWVLFVAGTLLIGIAVLFMPGSGFSAEDGWPEIIVLSVCGAATLFWLLVVPPWLYFGWRIDSGLAMALVGWLVLMATWVAVVQVKARSPSLLLALMAIVWIADTAAYFAGRRFGRRKLAPSISPGKTWEGVYGALFAVGAYALAMLPFAANGGYARALTIGAVAAWVVLVLLLAALSIAGDLFESLLKRQRGLKDSGSVLPGHGGILDRIDALTAAMPAAALIAHYLIR
jgi:phosphatidate cytidylyltransferase